MRRLLSALLFVFFLLPFQASAQTLTFSAIPDQDESRLVERFSRVEAYLEARLGIEVKYIPVKSYEAAITAFRNNQVQLAWFGGLSGVQARRLVPGSQALAQGAEDRAFTTYFIANSKTGLKPAGALSDDILGRSFTFGSKGSTSGRLMPEFYLRERFGKTPENMLSGWGLAATIRALSILSKPGPSRSARSISKSGSRSWRGD